MDSLPAPGWLQQQQNRLLESSSWFSVISFALTAIVLWKHLFLPAASGTPLNQPTAQSRTYLHRFAIYIAFITAETPALNAEVNDGTIPLIVEDRCPIPQRTPRGRFQLPTQDTPRFARGMPTATLSPPILFLLAHGMPQGIRPPSPALSSLARLMPQGNRSPSSVLFPLSLEMSEGDRSPSPALFPLSLAISKGDCSPSPALSPFTGAVSENCAPPSLLSPLTEQIAAPQGNHAHAPTLLSPLSLSFSPRQGDHSHTTPATLLIDLDSPPSSPALQLPFSPPLMMRQLAPENRPFEALWQETYAHDPNIHSPIVQELQQTVTRVGSSAQVTIDWDGDAQDGYLNMIRNIEITLDALLSNADQRSRTQDELAACAVIERKLQWWDFWKCFERLREMKIAVPAFIGDIYPEVSNAWDYGRVVARIPFLHTFKWEGDLRAFPKPWSNPLNLPLHQLQHLSLTSCKVSPRSCYSLLSSCDALISFELSSLEPSSVNDPFDPPYTGETWCPRLVDLKLTTSVDPQFIINKFTYNMSLRHLTLAFYGPLGFAGPALASMPWRPPVLELMLRRGEYPCNIYIENTLSAADLGYLHSRAQTHSNAVFHMGNQLI